MPLLESMLLSLLLTPVEIGRNKGFRVLDYLSTFFYYLLYYINNIIIIII